MQSGLCSCDFLCLFVTEEMRGGEMSLEHPGRFGQVWSMPEAQFQSERSTPFARPSRTVS
jgi:hypothetical protein